ncbi:MAG: hypothetical protein J5382_04605 [Bacteroidales bacterium]|nr:hypothetical protein [Bacteroidales bacterium]
MEQKKTATRERLTALSSSTEAKVTKITRPTKISRVLEHLESGRPITPLSALYLYNSFSLKDIICSLRSRGYNIQTEIVENEETGARFGKYSLISK